MNKRFKVVDKSGNPLIATNEKIFTVQIVDIGMLQYNKHQIREFKVKLDKATIDFHNSIHLHFGESNFLNKV